MSEHRSYRRISFRTEADIDIDNTAHRCELVDLALQGALFKSSKPLPLSLGALVPLSIYLPDSAVRMEFTGELIHQNGGYYGFLFITEEAESMAHLRRLLELNFGDAEQVEEEFKHWLKRDPVS